MTTPGPMDVQELHAARKRWRDLVRAHFTSHEDASFWCYNRDFPPDLPRQGWKIHISACITTAVEVLQAAVPPIIEENAYAKVLLDIGNLERLNSGLFYGYSQIGKFLTVYPADDEVCSRLAYKLAQATAGMGGPLVPFERRVAHGSPVFARYGLFHARSDNGREPGLIAPDGTVEPDDRAENPRWAVRPDGLFREPPEETSPGPIGGKYYVYDALTQRGKGGVYQAIDTSSSRPRKCVVKEGRRYGEVGSDGSDGYDRIAHEHSVLLVLNSRGIPVPQVYDYFEQGGHRYVVLEHIKGRCLADVLAQDRKPLQADQALELSIRVTRLLADIHGCGYVWRDFKAANIIILSDGRLRPVDFEGSLPAEQQLSAPWGSIGYVPKEWLQAEKASFTQDVFALGVLILQLHGCGLRPGTVRVDPDDMDGVPVPMREFLSLLLSDDPSERPSAEDVYRTLASMAT